MNAIYSLINAENLGNKIKLMIKVHENDNSYLVDIFRDSFNLSKNDFSDEILIKALKKADNDIELAFSYLY